MSVVLITGSSGLIGSESVNFFSKKDKSVKCQITINTESLRNDLTQNRVIRTFGF